MRAGTGRSSGSTPISPTLINRATIARLYNRHPAEIIVVNHDTALAIKVSFPRPQSSGSKHDSDVYGGQQYAPLLGLEVPSERPALARVNR